MLPEPLRPTFGPESCLSRGALLVLEPQLASCLAPTTGCFLAREVTHTQVSRVNEQTPAVDQHLRLARSRLDHGRALEDGCHPHAAPVVHLGLEVREDLVVFV